MEEAAAEVAPRPRVPQGRGGHRYRFRYEKTGAVALLGHLDLIRELPRILRRVGVPMVYTKGFHPKPDMSFGPALSLGVMSLDEYADLRFGTDLDPEALARLAEHMTRSSPAGLAFRDAVKLEAADPGITRVVAGARYVLAFARDALGLDEQALAARCAAAMAATTLPYRREISGIGKVVDVRAYLLRAEVAGEEARAALTRAGLVGDLVAVDVDCAITPGGAVKAAEVAAVIAGDGSTAPPHRAVRVALFGQDEAGRYAPLELGRGRRAGGKEEAPEPEIAEAGEVSLGAE